MPEMKFVAGMRRSALISLGSNAHSVWGHPTLTVQKAILVMQEMADCTALRSGLYLTPAFPAGAGPDFVNAAIRISTDLRPNDLLAVLHRIEAEAGRERTVRWGQRTLDLDLVAVDDLVLPDPATHQQWRDLSLEKQAITAPDQLILPHPRLQDRSFVLVPLADIAPDWVHPILGQTVKEMCQARPKAEVASVRPI